MPRRNFWFIAALIVILVFFIFFMPSYGWKLRDLFGSRPTMIGAGEDLVSENQTLSAELAKLKTIAAQMPQASPNTVRAMVYSRYPFNFKNELLLDAGSNEGIAAGKAVIFQGGFVGVVDAVFPDSATVQTIFDMRLKVPVRIGNSGIDGLLQGGSYPQVVSISKTAKVAVGDIVFTAAPGMSYGIPVAKLADVSLAPSNLFQQASLSFAYDVNGIQTVEIEK